MICISREREKKKLERERERMSEGERRTSSEWRLRRDVSFAGGGGCQEKCRQKERGTLGGRREGEMSFPLSPALNGPMWPNPFFFLI